MKILTNLKFWLAVLCLILPLVVFGADDMNTTDATNGKRVSIDMDDLGLVVGIILIVGGVLKNKTKLDNDWIPVITWVGGGLLYLGLSDGWGELRQWLAALMAVASATGLHSATTSTFDAAKNLKVNAGVGLAIVLGVLSFGGGLSGCRSVPVQVKAGHDPIVVHAEWLAENSLNSVDQFLAWERANESTLLKSNPGIHVTADNLRETFPAQLRDLREATKLYQAEKTKANGDKVTALTRSGLTIVNSVRSHMGLPPLELPRDSPSVSDLMKNAPTNGPTSKQL